MTLESPAFMRGECQSHGYIVIDVKPEQVTAQWWAVDTVLRPSNAETLMGSWLVESGKPKLIPA
ncbi:MAG: hypothetical protein HEQ35_10190 [Gloeotrichia echinulata IR180]|nr:hypothetical protein [Gloeotrichia echinulata DEX184]